MAASSDITFLENIGSNEFKVSDLKETLKGIEKAALMFIDKIAENADKKDVYSSGRMINGIEQSEVETNGSVLSVSISAPAYISYQDEGVDGWANSRGSRFKFKTKGVNPDGEMVKSIMDWQTREKSSNTKFAKYATSDREIKAKKIQSVEVKKAVATAYMIKRMGIKPKGFLTDAVNELGDILGKELGAALILDIKNSLI